MASEFAGFAFVWLPQVFLPLAMRPLTEDESKTVFTKLANYIVCTVGYHRTLQLIIALD